MLPDRLVLYFDGACEPTNPGGVGSYGWLIFDEQKFERARGQGIACTEGPRSTNNRAEYCALGFALLYLKNQGWKGHLTIKGDSRLVVEQMNQTWACNKQHLQELRARCWDLLKELGDSWEALWIPRGMNGEADRLSQAAWTAHTGKPFPQRRAKQRR